MRAMILAAGRGERMGPLTHHTPKPLLKIAGHYLIEYALACLKRADITEIVMNVSYHREQIKTALGNGQQYGVQIVYSEESERLETGGGIVNALPLLGAEPFMVISCDIITDFPVQQLKLAPNTLAHLVMVHNPSFHPEGDYGLQNGYLNTQVKPYLTYANVGLFHPQLFAQQSVHRFPLNHLLKPAILAQQITGEYYSGLWYNVGTPDDLKQVNQQALQDVRLQLTNILTI